MRSTKGAYLKQRLYVYTGTGNSLWVARQLATALPKAGIEFMPNPKKSFNVEADAVGIIFPVHIWGLPARVIQFVNHLKVKRETFLFAVAVNAGQPAATLVQLQRLMAVNHLPLSLGYSIVLPSNYIPWGGPGPLAVQRQLFRKARRKIEQIAREVVSGEPHKVERGPLWQNIFFSCLYRMSFRQVPKMDKKFWSDEKCNSCGTCAKICPAENIEMRKGRPVWLHRCEQCLACLQWCPQEAIQYGEKTPRYERYRHPDIQLKDMLAQAKTNR
jgi:Pyruvate/2-oxoacid:ferredoxin oxidoreductase delta subunit